MMGKGMMFPMRRLNGWGIAMLSAFALSATAAAVVDDFEAYSDAAELRKNWLEFDAGNPAPEQFEIGTLNGNALRVTAVRDYSLLYRICRNLPNADAAALTLNVKGAGSNPADAVLTVVARTEKNGAELGRVVVPLVSSETRQVALPLAGVGTRGEFALLLMFNKSGGQLTATVDDVTVVPAEYRSVDGFAEAADAAALRRIWPEFDSGNPAPEQQYPVTVAGRRAMRCVTGNRTYAVLKHHVVNPEPGRKIGALRIRLSGVAGNAKSGVIVFGARRSEGEANFAQMQIVPPEAPGEFVLASPEFAGLEQFWIVISFHKTAGQFDVTIEDVSVQFLP